MLYFVCMVWKLINLSITQHCPLETVGKFLISGRYQDLDKNLCSLTSYSLHLLASRNFNFIHCKMATVKRAVGEGRLKRKFQIIFPQPRWEMGNSNIDYNCSVIHRKKEANYSARFFQLKLSLQSLKKKKTHFKNHIHFSRPPGTFAKTAVLY